MSEFNTGNQSEFTHRSEVQRLVELTNIDPELLEGARYEMLHGEAATFDLREMQDINGEGLIAIIGVGNTALSLHAFGEGSSKNLYLTPGMIEEVAEGQLQKISMVPINPGTSPWFGRELPNKTKLGLIADDSISGSHFSLELSREGQLTVLDLSSGTGTELITKVAPRGKLDRLIGIPLEKNFGKVVVKDQLDS